MPTAHHSLFDYEDIDNELGEHVVNQQQIHEPCVSSNPLADDDSTDEISKSDVGK